LCIQLRKGTIKIKAFVAKYALHSVTDDFAVIPRIYLFSQDMRIQDLQLELHSVTSLQRSVSSTTSTGVAFSSASSMKPVPEYVVSLPPPVAASTSNFSPPSAPGNLQQNAMTQVHSTEPLKQPTSSIDAKQIAPEKRDIYSSGVAGRAIIPPDQDYHPTYQLQQFLQPTQPQDVPPSDFDTGHNTLLQYQIAGIASPISGQVYSEPTSVEQMPQSGQHVFPGHNVSLQRSGKATLQEQLAEVQKQLQMLSSGQQAQTQPNASHGSQPHIQFNSDTQWGTALAAEESQDALQFFA
jgi:hypothetical protein